MFRLWKAGTGSLGRASCWWFPAAVQQLVEVDSLGVPLRLFKLRIEIHRIHQLICCSSLVVCWVCCLSFLSQCRCSGSLSRWEVLMSSLTNWAQWQQASKSAYRYFRQVQSPVYDWNQLLHPVCHKVLENLYWLLEAAAAINSPSEMCIKMHFLMKPNMCDILRRHINGVY